MQDQSLLNLVGFFLPPVIDLINRKISDSDARRIVSILFCIVVGAAVNVINSNGNYSGLTWAGIVMSFAVTITSIMGMASITYKGIPNTKINWEDSNLRDDLKLNAKTN